jgi:thioredoxin
MLNLTDENFEQEIQNANKPVVIDFWAEWCTPCFILTPILEKLAEEYKDKFILAKVNLAEARTIAQKYGVERIPMVVLFNGGKPISGFIGARPEPQVRELLDKMLKDCNPPVSQQINKKPEDIEDNTNPSSFRAGLEPLIKNYQEYAEKNGFRLNPNREVVERLIKGMLENEKKFGGKYCPCRRISGNPEEDKGKICPCQWHREEIERDGHCFCGLFVK